MTGRDDFPNGPQFSWSTSRQTIYDNCPRQYWYQYYGYWGGWSDREYKKHRYEDDARQIYFLKNRKNIPAWTGDIAHRWIGELISGSSSLHEAKQSSESEAREAWEASSAKANNKKIQGTMKPKDHLFLEHLDEDPDEDHLADSIDAICESLESIEENGLPQQYNEAIGSGRYAFSENTIPDDDWDTMSIQIPIREDSVKVFTKLDCVIETKQNTFEILDWKTGRPPSDTSLTFQLRLYTLWLHEKLGRLPRPRLPEDCRIEAYAVYLPDHIKQGGMISMGTVEETQVTVRSHVHHLYQLHHELVDSDGYLNKGMRDSCDSEPHKTKCTYCNWKSICPDSESG
jgi:hypothetical protein